MSNQKRTWKKLECGTCKKPIQRGEFYYDWVESNLKECVACVVGRDPAVVTVESASTRISRLFAWFEKWGK